VGTSEDGTVDAVERFGDRVTLVRRDHGGERAAKNTAARAARGDFVVILDADDRWLPRRLEALAVAPRLTGRFLARRERARFVVAGGLSIGDD
jgi:glycosyltransferase involved in cell wall biosynthesis